MKIDYGILHDDSVAESLKKIEYGLKRLTDQQVLTRNLKPFNIFDKMCEAVQSEIDTNEFLSLNFVSSTCSKVIADARRGNKTSSQFWFDYLGYDDTQETESTQLIKNSVLFPAMAYLKYQNEDYPAAISDLKIAISELDSFGSKQQMPLILAACVEQYYNICKVFLRQEDYKEGFTDIGRLLYYLHTGENHTSVNFGKWTNINELDDNVRHLMIDMITNNSLLNLFYQDKDVDYSKYFNQLFQYFMTDDDRIDNPYFQSYRGFIVAISGFQNSTYADFLIILNERLDELYKLPEVFQNLVLDSLNELVALLAVENIDRFKDLTDRYFEKANIKPIDRKKSNRRMYKSPLR